MRDLYEIGPVYIWQNQVGEAEHLNGTECRVVDHVTTWRRGKLLAQETDTPVMYKGRPSVMMAEAGDLRRKNLPSGERLILEQFLPEFA